ncbi:MAG: YfiR family protein [Ginsengibacter sp.]
MKNDADIIYSETTFSETGKHYLSVRIFNAIRSLINYNFKLIFPIKGFLKIFFYFNLLFLLPGIFKPQAQQNTNYALYSNIIYRFTKYINWPPDKKSGDFIIGIVGDSPLYDELKNFTLKKCVGDQKKDIKEFSSSATSFTCHILIIGEDKSGSMNKIAYATRDVSILLVSEADGLALKRSCINIIIVDNHLKIEINKNNI